MGSRFAAGPPAAGGGCAGAPAGGPPGPAGAGELGTQAGWEVTSIKTRLHDIVCV